MILDNHFHAIIAAPELSRVKAAVKRHTAQRIVEGAPSRGQRWLVEQFERRRAGHKTESQHQVWQEGFHPQELSSDEAMLQKIDYVH